MTVPFENDTGNIVRKLARKSLKVRSAGILWW